MGLGIDGTRPLRNPQQLAELVQAIHAALPQDESDWIEWKAGLDLSRKETHGTLARHILGMANRRTEDAARYMGGCAYVVLGVEPGLCPGVTPLDPADLGLGVEPYLGSDGPSWGMQYVQVSGGSVLVITVEPPQAGSRAFTLQKECPKPGGGRPYLAGTIFVRRPGRTIQAEPGDIRALEDRYAAVAQPIALIVRPTSERASIDFRPLGDFTVALDDWLARERRQLLPDIDSDRKTGRIPPGFEEQIRAVEVATAAAVRSFEAISHPDKRTEDEYQAEIAEYLVKCRSYFEGLLLSRYGELETSIMGLELVNTSERNYTDVQVQVFPSGVAVFDPDTVPGPGKFSRPRRPMKRGSRRLAGFQNPLSDLSLPLGVAPREPSFTVVSTGPAKVTYDVGRIRPEQHIPLDQVVIGAMTAMKGTALEVNWAVATGNVDGVARGSFELRIGRPIDIIDVVPELSDGSLDA